MNIGAFLLTLGGLCVAYAIVIGMVITENKHTRYRVAIVPLVTAGFLMAATGIAILTA